MSIYFSPNKLYDFQKNKKLALNSGIETNQILTNDDEVCIPRLSSILLAVLESIQDLNFKWRIQTRVQF